MSAFILSKAHIDTLTNAAIQLRKIAPSEAEGLGQLLWEENYRSVNFRYQEDEPCPKYERDVFDAPFHPGAILWALSCYEYQSCECPEWPDSKAAKWCRELGDAVWDFAYRSGISETEVMRVKNETPWGIENMRDVPVLDREV